MAKDTTMTLRVIGIAIALVFSAIGGGYTVAWAQASIGSSVETLETTAKAHTKDLGKHDVRIRENEQFRAATGATLKAMQTDITFIRKLLERRSMP